MSPSTRPAAASDRRASKPIAGEDRPNLATISIAAWLIPGAGHLVQGQPRKAAIFFVTLILMFVLGLGFGGRLFPFQLSEPLVLLEAVAEWLLGVPSLIARLGGYGQGQIVAATYEYGNTFLIVSGLLNALVILDAVDLAAGRKPR